MLKAFSLLLPALIPSWNFFDVIAPSPRIEYALLPARTARPVAWHEFRPRPQTLSLGAMVRRLLWNPQWNEALFLVSCAERLINQPTAHSQDEIFRRIAADLSAAGPLSGTEPWLCFRLVFLSRDGDTLRSDILFVAEPRRLAAGDL